MDAVSWTFVISLVYRPEDWSLYTLYPIQASGMPVFWACTCPRGEFWQDSAKCSTLPSHYNKHCLAKRFQWKLQRKDYWSIIVLGNSCSVFLPRQKGSQNCHLRAWPEYGNVVGQVLWAAGKLWISCDRVYNPNQNKKAKLMRRPTWKPARLAQEESSQDEVMESEDTWSEKEQTQKTNSELLKGLSHQFRRVPGACYRCTVLKAGTDRCVVLNSGSYQKISC